ncbi:MAG: hypothetical protein ACFCU3_06920 [Verrucomicrobiales bacterium]
MHSKFPRLTSGFALVIVLMMVIISTILVTAFVSTMRVERGSSSAYRSGFASGELASGAAQAIIDALVQEMEAGSTATGDGVARVMLPTASENQMPQITIPEAARATLPNVLRVSSSDDAALGDFPEWMRAAGGPTDVATNIGRRIAPQRWAAPALFHPDNADDLPTPEWILWTRDGPVSAAAQPGDVVGRFAYVVYQTGGLLNANVAGYPRGADLPSAAEIGRKGSLAFADLTQIPGFDDASADLLVRWRERLPMPNDWVTEAREFRNAGARSVRQDGNAFFDRQELIRFLRNEIGLDNAAEALPFLTVHSTARNAPSVVPDPDRPRVGDSNVTKIPGSIYISLPSSSRQTSPRIQILNPISHTALRG